MRRILRFFLRIRHEDRVNKPIIYEDDHKNCQKSELLRLFIPIQVAFAFERIKTNALEIIFKPNLMNYLLVISLIS